MPRGQERGEGAMEKFVIGFSGKIGSGKSSIARATAAALDVPCASFGDYIRRVARDLALDPADRGVLQDIGNLLVKHPKQFCAQVLREVDYRPGTSLVIEGIRHKQILDELAVLVAPTPLVLVYVRTDEGVVEERLHREGIPDPTIQLLEQDATEAQVTTLLPKFADFVLDGSREWTGDQIRTEVVPTVREYLTAGGPLHWQAAPFTPEFGGSKGTFRMADDFDEPLDDFADYT
jgi:dephospho-CoA kinase